MLAMAFHGAPVIGLDPRSVLMAIRGALIVLFCYRSYALRAMA
jgi:hypothetical protein